MTLFLSYPFPDRLRGRDDPAGLSEVALATLLLQISRRIGPLLLAVATAGNTLGGIANWVLGRFLLHWQDRKWFPVSRQRLDQAAALVARVWLSAAAVVLAADHR